MHELIQNKINTNHAKGFHIELLATSYKLKKVEPSLKVRYKPAKKTTSSQVSRQTENA